MLGRVRGAHWVSKRLSDQTLVEAIAVPLRPLGAWRTSAQLSYSRNNVVGQKLVFCPPSWAGGKLLPYGWWIDADGNTMLTERLGRCVIAVAAFRPSHRSPALA